MDLMNEISKAGLTVEQYEECIQLVIDKKNNINDIDWQEICNRYNLPISADTLRKANGTIFGGAFIAEYFREKTLKSESATQDEMIENMQKSFNTETSINKDGTYSSNRLLVMNDAESKD